LEAELAELREGHFALLAISIKTSLSAQGKLNPNVNVLLPTFLVRVVSLLMGRTAEWAVRASAAREGPREGLGHVAERPAALDGRIAGLLSRPQDRGRQAHLTAHLRVLFFFFL
jgi:hypothetical protein